MPSPRRDTGTVQVGWIKVSAKPERWQRPGSGTIEACGDALWSVIGTCGHAYTTVSLALGRKHAEEREGFCCDCWLRSKTRALGG
jgi:hypothetical protein